MHDSSRMLARPEASDQLVLLFHGVGSSAQDFAPVGQMLAQARPLATVVSVEAPHRSQLGRGKEWFSVVGVTEDNRPQRITEAMPLFLQTIHHWQGLTGLGADRTVLVGFSQGAIMSLESTQTTIPSNLVAHAVIALAGRFAKPVRHVPPDVRVHLIHGEQDGVVLPQWSIQASTEWSALGGDVTLDLVPDLGHGIDTQALGHVVKYLKQD